MTTQQALYSLFSKREWWKDSEMNESSAGSYKKKFPDGKPEIETQIKTLTACGFKVVQQMQREKL